MALETKMDIVIDQQKSLNTKLDNIIPAFATKEELLGLKQDIIALKKRNWVQNTLSAVLGVVLTLLITYAFRDVIGV